ncbi:hypothetical protein LG047_10805 [Methylocystis sp. WRRC1]|uniref:hypothetical protein n=1 Tax=Methylocystis sp. WRRC1 TaxID=1732014 RepID=UPI001D138FA1|nr:hypothetical protein [Methylocystis sp. WRRC1]MCC3245812.1 hypothetical protein [Methylocystis sp. WRRC1]
MKATLGPQGAIDASGREEMTAYANARAAQRVATNFHLLLAATLVFLLPNAIFATALRPAPAALVLIGCGAIAAFLWRLPRAGAFLSAPLDPSSFGACLAAGIALCLLGGEGHFFYSTHDWLIRDAVLSDLVKNGFTVLYNYESQDYLLRAPLGMYMIPATVGRAFGLHAAHIALLTQNAFLVGAVAYFVASLANVRKTPMLLLFFAFSGMDVVPILVAEAIEIFVHNGFLPFTHIEWWGDYYTTIRLQYSSHLTQLFWVPNHMAPGWWFAVLALLHARGEVDLGALLVSFAAMLLWSPLAMMGAAPFIALFALQAGARGLFSSRTIMACAAGLCLLPIALYLTMDAAEVPHEWLITRDGFALYWPAFIAIELPQIAIIAYAWSKVEAADRRILLLAIGMLIFIPICSMGPSNDFVMRSSIAPLFFIAFAFSRIAVLTPRDNGRFATAISVIVILSFATPMLEIKQAFRGSYAISDCNMLTSWHKGDISIKPTNYWARVEKVPAWLMSAEGPAPLTVEDRKCWPDHSYLNEAMK